MQTPFKNPKINNKILIMSIEAFQNQREIDEKNHQEKF